MERRTEARTTRLPVEQWLIDLGFREGETKGFHEGETKGFHEGETKGFSEGRLEGLREALLRLVARAEIPLSEDDRARIRECNDAATLDRWVDNVIGAKTAGDVLS